MAENQMFCVRVCWRVRELVWPTNMLNEWRKNRVDSNESSPERWRFFTHLIRKVMLLLALSNWFVVPIDVTTKIKRQLVSAFDPPWMRELINLISAWSPCVRTNILSFFFLPISFNQLNSIQSFRYHTTQNFQDDGFRCIQNSLESSFSGAFETEEVSANCKYLTKQKNGTSNWRNIVETTLCQTSVNWSYDDFIAKYKTKTKIQHFFFEQLNNPSIKGVVFWRNTMWRAKTSRIFLVSFLISLYLFIYSIFFHLIWFYF